MEHLVKKLAGPGPQISVQPGVSLFLFFFFWNFFLTGNRGTAFFTGDYSTLTNRFSSIMKLIEVVNMISSSSPSYCPCVAWNLSYIPCCFKNHEKENKRIHYSVNLTNKGNKTLLHFFLSFFLFFFFLLLLLKSDV